METEKFDGRTMLVIYHVLMTTVIVFALVGILLVLGIEMPIRYSILLIIGLYFFGVGVDIDHVNGQSVKQQLLCAMSYTEGSVDDPCRGFHRQEMHTWMISYALIGFAVSWLMHLKMDGVI